MNPELLFALLAGDLAALEKRFRIDANSTSAAGWRLALAPTDESVARVFNHVELEGDRYVRRVRLDEVNGDVTAIRFDKLAEAPEPNAGEARRLAE